MFPLKSTHTWSKHTRSLSSDHLPLWVAGRFWRNMRDPTWATRASLTPITPLRKSTWLGSRHPNATVLPTTLLLCGANQGGMPCWMYPFRHADIKARPSDPGHLGPRGVEPAQPSMQKAAILCNRLTASCSVSIQHSLMPLKLRVGMTPPVNEGESFTLMVGGWGE